MNFDDTARLLAQIAVIDSRAANRDVVLYWAELFRDVDFRDASQAVIEHRRTSTEYLQPAHVFQGVQRAREARLARFRLLGGGVLKKLAEQQSGGGLFERQVEYKAALDRLTEDVKAGRLVYDAAVAEIEA